MRERNRDREIERKIEKTKSYQTTINRYQKKKLKQMNGDNEGYGVKRVKK